MNKLILNLGQAEKKINKNIYGHFAEHIGRCIYEGIWVGEDSSIPNTRGIRNDVVGALKKINIPVLRWPGGCFADEYHWKDSISPRKERKKLLNTYWGGVVESNHFGTHEFFDLCEQLDAEPYICANVGSGTVQEMQQWVEYMTYDGESSMTSLRKENGREKPWKLNYFGIGNENWGCGGNMRPEYYADLYRRFQTFVRDYGDNKLFRIAGGSYKNEYRWTGVLMDRAGEYIDGLSLHYYTIPGPWENKGSAIDFTKDEWKTTMTKALYMYEVITNHSTIMDRYDPEKKVALIIDEWGTWFNVEKGTHPRFLFQQNTLRDALVAGIKLNIFNNHCGRVQMANIAQTVNVLQAVILTKGKEMILTPTFHVFEMYKVHQGASMVPIYLDAEKYGGLPQISVSSSLNKEKNVNITLCNLDTNSTADVNCIINGYCGILNNIKARILTSFELNSHNTFENPDRIKPEAFHDYKYVDGGLYIQIPPASIVLLMLELEI